ncbi:hypothetical protein [Pseudoduganella rhizocola]|uniref:hypothetical protein n=1 Tax=Pseudoduganella rhizocola TaxID=3382643 RepID=UPI0038B4EA4F
MKHRSFLSLALLSSASLALPAYAGDDTPRINITGFGTVALTRSDTADAEFIRHNQAAGVKKEFRTGVDSNFGIQGTFQLTERLSAVAQGLVSKNATDAYGAELTWAFLKYKLNEDWSVRLGRTTPPNYLISDFRNVGYANLMIRPPGDMYRQITVGSIDGVDLLYQRSVGDTTYTAQLNTGRGKRTVPNGAFVDFDRMTTLHLVAEHGPYTFRYGHTDARFSFRDAVPLITLLAGLRNAGFGNVADALNPYDRHGKFDSLGFGLDYKNVLLQAEYAKKKINSRAVPDTTSWYAQLGYRYGQLTPYFMHSYSRQDVPRSFDGLPAASPANNATKAPQQRDYALGLRWDFAKSAALKLQVDHIRPRDGAGGFIKATPQFKGPVNVYAAGVDFVF